MENVMKRLTSGPVFPLPRTEDKIAAICCDNLKRYASGLPLKNLIL
jgi:hypothetical protein